MYLLWNKNGFLMEKGVDDSLKNYIDLYRHVIDFSGIFDDVIGLYRNFECTIWDSDGNVYRIE